MPEAYIVDAVRTPVGKRGGGLAQVHPADLGAHVITRARRALGHRPGRGRGRVLRVRRPARARRPATSRAPRGSPPGYSEDVPGTTIDRQCGSSQQALHFAAQAVMSGTNDVIVAGGVQNMSMIPIAAALTAAEPFGFADPFSGSEGWVARYGDQEISQFRGAELIAEKWGISREDMEVFALESHERAIRAQDEGRFDGQIVPLRGVELDEGPRRGTSLEKMAQLPPLEQGGRLTAAVSSQISDAASGMLVVSEQAVRDHGLTPRARVHHLSVRGDSPVLMLSAPIPATAYALEKTGMTLDDIDLVEINEAFASVVLAWQKETGADLAKVNVNGGAIALGHPLGATGHAAHDDAAVRARAHRRPLRTPDDVRGRRPGQRDHHRAPAADGGVLARRCRCHA